MVVGIAMSGNRDVLNSILLPFVPLIRLAYFWVAVFLIILSIALIPAVFLPTEEDKQKNAEEAAYKQSLATTSQELANHLVRYVPGLKSVQVTYLQTSTYDAWDEYHSSLEELGLTYHMDTSGLSGIGCFLTLTMSDGRQYSEYCKIFRKESSRSIEDDVIEISDQNSLRDWHKYVPPGWVDEFKKTEQTHLDGE